MSVPDSVDVLIVGGGPSGLSAALCLSRACYKTAIFDSGNYRNEQAHHMHMFPTWDHKDPDAYRLAARKELEERYPHYVNFVNLAVTAVGRNDEGKPGIGGFYAVDAEGGTWQGRKLLLASGVTDILPEIPGYKECWITGIFHCPFCHGYEDRGADSVGVLAIDLMAAMPPITDGIVRNVLQFTKRVVVYTNGATEVEEKLKPLLAKKTEVEFDNRAIEGLRKEPVGAAVTIQFKDKSEATHGFLMHSPKMEMNLAYVKGLELQKSPMGMELQVSQPWQETTEPGCFAVGDTGTMGKIIVAGVAYGTFAAMGIVKQLQAD
ncbi:MAG: hypothetical protein Q9160_000642 [Pyrenula sp. 1 TL-2023]